MTDQLVSFLSDSEHLQYRLYYMYKGRGDDICFKFQGLNYKRLGVCIMEKREELDCIFFNIFSAVSGIKR